MFIKNSLINEYIFDGFLVITLGSFGIASIDKWTNRKKDIDSPKQEEEEG